jgi:hypothetical protein
VRYRTAKSFSVMHPPPLHPLGQGVVGKTKGAFARTDPVIFTGLIERCFGALALAI